MLVNLLSKTFQATAIIREFDAAQVGGLPNYCLYGA